MYVMKICNEALPRQTIHTRLQPQTKMESQNYTLMFVILQMEFLQMELVFSAMHCTMLCWYPVSSPLMGQWASLTLV